MVSYLAVFFAWLSLLFIVGHLASRVLAKASATGFYLTVLRNILAGYVVVIIVVSVFQTQFKTVNIVLLLIGGLICFEARRNRFHQTRSSPVVNWRHIVTIIMVATSLFLIPWFTISNSESYLGFFYNQIDYVLYSRISESLMVNGHENGFGILNALDDYYSNPEPYHFFDLWGAAAVSRLFSVNVFPALLVIIYPTFYLLCFTGYMALFKKSNLTMAMLAFAFLWVGGVALSFIDFHPFFKSLANLSYNLLTPLVYKLSYFYVFLITAFVLFRSGYAAIAVLVLLGLPVANIITFPTVIPSLLIFATFMYFLLRTGRKELTLSLVYTVLVAAAIVIFYFINQRESAGLAGAEISRPFELIKGTLSFADLGTRRNIVLGGVLSIFVMYSPYFVAMALNWRRFSRTALAIFPLIAIAISLLAWAVLFNELNSSQIFSNIAVVIVNVTIVIVLSEIVNSYGVKSEFGMRFAVSVVLLAMAISFQIAGNVSWIGSLRASAHSESYLKSVDDLVAPNSIVGCIRAVEEMTPVHAKYNAVYSLGDYLLLQNDNSFAVNISDLSTPIDSTSAMNLSRSLKAIRDGLFYRFSKLSENLELNEHQLMEKFLNQYGIRYLIVSKGAVLPATLRERAKVIIRDPLSGEQFVELQ